MFGQPGSDRVVEDDRVPHDDVAEPNSEYFERREAVADGIVSYEPTSLHEFGAQPAIPDEYRGDLDFERYIHRECSIRAGNFIVYDPLTIVRNLRILEVRCPERGCYLGDVFRFPLDDGGERFLAMTNKVRGESRAIFLNWAFSDDWRGMTMYLPATCRHGSVRLRTGWLMDCVFASRGYYKGRPIETMLGAEITRGVRSGTFMPDPTAWRPKKAASQSGNVQPRHE